MDDDQKAEFELRLAELEHGHAARAFSQTVAFALLAKQLAQRGAIDGATLIADLREQEEADRRQNGHEAGIRYLRGLRDVLPPFVLLRNEGGDDQSPPTDRV